MRSLKSLECGKCLAAEKWLRRLGVLPKLDDVLAGHEIVAVYDRPLLRQVLKFFDEVFLGGNEKTLRGFSLRFLP